MFAISSLSRLLPAPRLLGFPADAPPLARDSQGSKTLAPGDKYRREQRKKEVAKNKAQRKSARDDALKTADVASLRDELHKLHQHKKLGLASNEKLDRIKVLERAIEEREEERRAKAAKGAPEPAPAVKVKTIGALRARGTEIVAAGTARVDSGLGERRPQDSVYYHPTLNPTGRPPPGKPQKYKSAADAGEADEAAEDEDEDEDDGWGIIGQPRVPLSLIHI